MGAEYAALGVLDERGDKLAHFETSGVTPEQHQKIGALPTGRGLLGHVIREGRPIRIARMNEHPLSHGFPPHHPPMNSFLGVPITTKDKVFGNLYLTEKAGGGGFTEDDERIAVLLAAQAAVAIDNARLNDAQVEMVLELKTMQRQRDQFFAMINHELRNALTGVYGWAQQLRRSKSEATTRRAIEEVNEAAERTIVLVNNLLELSRLDAGKVQAVFRDAVLSQVIRRAWAVVEPAAQARNVVLREEHHDAPATVHTDPQRLEQVLVNLFSNAVRHSPADEAIMVQTDLSGEQVRIHVSDRGPGIAADDQPRIFEPFIRVDPESGLGSGLGLPVSRRMAELIGGSLTVHSDLGRGATFTVAIPANHQG